MDEITHVQSNIHGSHSGNQGNSSVFGSNNLNVTGNVYLLPNVTHHESGNRSGVLGVGDEAEQAPRPYRLIPYGRNRTFTGRKNLIESVKKFSECEGHNRVALYGLGGSGKTQITLEYVYQYASEHDRDVFWVQGSGLLKFMEGYTAISQHIRIPLPSAETDEEAFLRGIRRWFEGPNSGDWILVVDNADNEADFVANNGPIAKFIPQGAKGTLVFTTRSRQVASRQGCKMIEVGKMGEEEAAELFSKRFGSWDGLEEEEKKVAAMILGSVDYLPLAIIGLAAFMIETATPPSIYWTILQENEDRMKRLLSRQFCDIQREADMAESVLGTYFVTFDRIRQQIPAAADMLQLMAFLDRQNIPEELLSQCGLEGVRDPVDFREAIGKLLGFSLVTIVKREGKTLYEFHRLVQLSLQVYLPTKEFNQGRSAALQLVSRLFPRYGGGAVYLGATYIPHAFAVTKGLTDPIAEELCFRMGVYPLDICSYNNAELQFRRCVALRAEGKEYDWDGQGYRRLMYLGRVRAYQGKFDESETIHRRILAECESVLGPDHPDTPASASDLAQVLYGQGRYDESEMMVRRALEAREKVLGLDHPNTLATLCNLATVLASRGKHGESETMIRRALEGHEKTLGLHNRATLVCVHSLATVLCKQGKYDESEAMNRHALERQAEVLGSDHPDTLASVAHLATVLWNQGKYDELEAMNRHG